MSDSGLVPDVLNSEQVMQQNQNFRCTLWTGNRLHVCISFRCEIGLELHPDTDQLIRIEDGQASVCMGKRSCPFRAAFIPEMLF